MTLLGALLCLLCVGGGSHFLNPLTPTPTDASPTPPTESIIMRLEGLMSKENLKEADMGKLREKLQAIDAEWKEGKIGGGAGGAVVSRGWCRCAPMCVCVRGGWRLWPA